MTSKNIVYTAVIIGSIIGALIPKMFGASIISIPSFFLSFIGAVVGYILAWKWLS